MRSEENRQAGSPPPSQAGSLTSGKGALYGAANNSDTMKTEDKFL
jgi:hypothetical protein